jgi:hypothetical protein
VLEAVPAGSGGTMRWLLTGAIVAAFVTFTTIAVVAGS